jgi:hypothetical protein
MIENYKMKTPYERDDGVEAPAAALAKKTTASSKTIAPWAYGAEPAPKNTYKRVEQPQTMIWDNLEKKPVSEELVDSSGDPVLDGFRAQIKKRGASGVLGLSKKVSTSCLHTLFA